MPALVRDGRPYLDEATSRRVALSVSAKLVELGVTTGEAFAYMRRALNLKAADLAALLDLRPETLSQWENGHVGVNRAAWGLLAALIDRELGRGASPLDHLRAANAPKKKMPKHVRIEAIAI